jgi:hypothetical protein
MTAESGPDSPRQTSCPSAPPEPGATLFGIVTAPGQVAYLNPGVPATQDLIDSFAREGVPIENRMRFSGRCMEHRCVQWSGQPGNGRCGLVDRALEALNIMEGPEVLPNCAIRATCRWYAQHKRNACAACPEVIRRPAAP